MASFADAFNVLTETGLIQAIIPFLLVYVVSYGVLNRIKFIEKNELNAALAFILALAVSMSPLARTFITSVTPALATFGLLLFLFLLVLFSSGFQIKDVERIMAFTHDEGNIMWAVLISIGVVIIVASLANAYPDAISFNADLIKQKAAEQNISVNEYVNTLPVGERVLFFISLPQVMGLIVLILIFAFAGVLLLPPLPKK